MTRRHITFSCGGSELAGTIDDADGETGLLIVSGGNETRAGAFRSQADLAARISAEGFPVMRFDRRGVGDSQGANGGFQSSAPDIAAALETFRSECPQLDRIFGFGNCDAASALMLAEGQGLDGMILSNPWTFEGGAQEAPPEAVRAHYRQRLGDRAAIKRLLTGQVSLRKLLRSLLGALRPQSAPSSLAQEMAFGIEAFAGEIAFLIAERDRTGQSFIASWKRTDPRIRICGDATHGYVEPHAREWLFDQVVEMMKA